ncbi:MAG: hypothetical protein JWP34_358 [Massilia sp.]|jgi:hypothetical protein|nr:hypothetical protein [Massilia sp.]
MSSTNDAQMAAVMEALFDEVLAPIAQRMRASGEQAFPLEPDVSWLSYYVRRKRAFMTRADFTAASCVDVADLGLRLGAHWKALGRHELAAQAARFGAAAGAAQVLLEAAAPEAELSPYVYAMF